MKLHEYQAKNLYAKYNIPIPKGRIATSASEARRLCEELGGKVVVKAQVLVSGRGKAGGVRLVKTPEEAEEVTTSILSMKIKDLPVRKVLVDEAISISKEIYLGITNDRAAQKPVLIACGAGGVDIEEVAQKTPGKIAKMEVDSLLGLRDYQIRDIALSIDLPRQFWRPFGEIIYALWKVYTDCDATMAEINPLVITADNHLVALDAKIVLDENALFRHPDLADLRDIDGEDWAETQGRKFGVSFVKMEGDIGCMVNGAGLAMATMDIISHFGGKPANFLDIGGGASSEKVASAIRLILADRNVKAILINVFGGITRCDEVAEGIVRACRDVASDVPMVVRLVGTNEDKARQILSGASLVYADSLVEGAKKAIDMVRKEDK
ncbi:MAG TPA: ADP-forming succinate--CoA ligase subunit beta [Anaerolineaceae bacterium]|jgi:succinyl-CoA synthetase beta subunit|nr:ADP-forming succinate--CoA ligase subunit beta [Anaerolineaceae bacterium]HNS06483.1 ADP-forming succinate--CoA ligase subunit beta [Anaerolineaceae bacterium]HNW14292.1 ADP-forming succinate--CoA ligase subunit beta [Anaerolineaceae bacterium]HOE02825.1 ADP-forming succinate--CoA ligase subunit beta [Anaerolineaceae bacterium]HOQ68376.1 ADP-forming succinate--CoA ligase subunit beta [Anaerolineaceae bacterium]